MSAACPIAVEVLHDYFAGALAGTDEASVEEHVFTCDRCAAAFDAAGALADGLRRWVPPVVSHAWLARERARGTPVRLVDLRDGAQTAAEFSRGLTFLVFVLRGDLAGASHVAVEVCNEAGEHMSLFEPVPFDAERGEVLIACQRHYLDEFPRALRFRVLAGTGEAQRVVGEFGVDHLLPLDT
ncbi:MAG TPA: zf-HC2 domain-containing protein [Kofleriaceae bacterium]|nr:zf-HC2 domain-containing protein [Kofleriaceae bacterium]